jgi:anaerobic magnesium-protoporphyrin IX monomethyl ester cyclase
MQVLFIYSNHNLTNQFKPFTGYYSIAFGISYLSSILKKNGHNTSLLVLTHNYRTILNNYINIYSPKLICFSPVATEYPFIVNIAHQIKERYPAIYLLAGGPHVSLNPEACITDSFDALCVGEGEGPILELTQTLEKGLVPSSICNLWIKQGLRVEKNPTRSFMCDLDELPFPDREMWEQWILDPASVMSIILGRGCPFYCTYCCNHALRKIASGPYVRLRSTDNILKEIKEINVRFPLIKEIYLEIETFGIDINWSIDLCEKLGEFNTRLHEPISFGVNLRITNSVLTDVFFNALKNGNIKYIEIGLQSGSEKIRREVLRRYESNSDIIEAVRLARKYNIKFYLYNLLGIPGETMKDYYQTVAMNRMCQPDGHITSIFYPYPGTDLFALCKKWGLSVDHLEHEMEREKAILDLPNYSKKDIQSGYIWFNYNIYKGYKSTYKLMLGVIECKLRIIFPKDKLFTLTIFNYLVKLLASAKQLFIKD